MRRLALALTLAAVLVAAPRLVLIFLEADSLQPGAEVRTALLGASGAALALVLTGGGAYLVHAIVRVGRFQRLLFALWLVILTCIAVLVTPRLVAGLQGASTPLAQVLETPALRWAWSATAVLAAELVATGCMIAYAAEHQQQHRVAELHQELEQLGQQRNRIQQQLLQANQRLEEQEQLLLQHRREQRQLQEEQQHLEEQRRLQEEQQHLGEQQPPAAPRTGSAAAKRAAAAKRGGSSAPKSSSRPRSPDSTSAREIPCRYGCGYVAPSIPAERGHLASCPNHPKYTPEAGDA